MLSSIARSTPQRASRTPSGEPSNQPTSPQLEVRPNVRAPGAFGQRNLSCPRRKGPSALIAEAIELRDIDTAGHSRRVAVNARALGARLGLEGGRLVGAFRRLFAGGGLRVAPQGVGGAEPVPRRC